MFADYYRQLGEADMPFAKQCMAHWRRFLMGPPNKPNEDVYGLLDVSIDSFQSIFVFIIILDFTKKKFVCIPHFSLFGCLFISQFVRIFLSSRQSFPMSVILPYLSIPLSFFLHSLLPSFLPSFLHLSTNYFFFRFTL